MTRPPGGHMPATDPGDAVPALLSEGEAWVGAAAFNRYGAEFFAQLGGIRPENVHPVRPLVNEHDAAILRAAGAPEHTFDVSPDVPESGDTLTPLDQASGYELIDWALHVRSRASPPPKTIRCTVEQVEKIADLAAPAPRPKVNFGMETSILGLPVEWVTDSIETTAFEGRTLVALGNVRKTSPSDEDVARWRAEAAARRAREDARHAQLLAAGGVVAAIAGLHSPEGDRECGGCDYSGAEPEPPGWPCRTWELLDE